MRGSHARHHLTQIVSDIAPAYGVRANVLQPARRRATVGDLSVRLLEGEGDILDALMQKFRDS